MSAFQGYLLDEHVVHALKRAIAVRAPEVPVYTIGDGVAPPAGTPDPAILVWLELERCVLVTENRASMPVHLAGHLMQGRHVPGIVQLPEIYRIGEMAEILVELWQLAEGVDLADRITHVPL
jgi:hypothetical protein